MEKNSSGRIPYTDVSVRFSLDERMGEDLKEFNRVLESVPHKWKPEKEYLRGPRKERFDENPIELGDEFGSFVEGEDGYELLSFKYQNDKGQYLRIDLDLEKDNGEYAPSFSIELVTFHPEFKQGLDNLEFDFLPESKKNLADLLDKMQLRKEPWSPYDSSFESDGADWFEKIDFDEEEEDAIIGK